LIGSEFIGLLSLDSVDDAVHAGHLVELTLEPAQRSEVDVASTPRPIGFLRRADTSLSPIATALREEILALCMKLGYHLVATEEHDHTDGDPLSAYSERAKTGPGSETTGPSDHPTSQ
jgi:hypothetical protein